MNEPAHKPTPAVTGTQFLVMAAAFVVVVAGMQAAQPILIPFLIAAFAAVICFPPLKWLQDRGVPQVVALLIVISGMAVSVVLAVALIGTSVSDFTGKVPMYKADVAEKQEKLVDWLEGHGIDVSEEAEKGFDTRRIMQLISTMLSGVGSAFSNGFVVLLTLLFILLEAASFPKKLTAMFGSNSSQMEQANKIRTDVRHYIAIKTTLSIVTGVLIAIWLRILGVDYPLMWGFLAFLLNYVPNIGSIIAAVPAVLLALIQLGPGNACLAAGGYLVVNGVIGNLIEPRVMGRGLGLSTLVVFLSLVFWGWVLGPVGMLLSVPLTMVIKIALENTEDLRWVALLLSAEGAVESNSGD